MIMASPSDLSGRPSSEESEPARETSNLDEMKQQAKEQLSDIAQTAKEQANAAAEPVKQNAREIAEQQKQRHAGSIDSIANAVHCAADDLGDEMPQAATYIHSGAEQLERASRLLRENSVDDLMQMASRLAHERPLTFIGGSVIAGFALGRFLRSSASSPDGMQTEARP
jgi:hypothetical protein